MQSHPEPLMTLKEAAHALRVAVRTVERLIRNHQLACVRVGRCVRIEPDQVRDYLERSRQEVRS